MKHSHKTIICHSYVRPKHGKNVSSQTSHPVCDLQHDPACVSQEAFRLFKVFLKTKTQQNVKLAVVEKPCSVQLNSNLLAAGLF